MCCESTILDWLQFGATALVGLAATFIALNQLRVSREKLRFDLYNKRFNLYKSFMNYIKDRVNDSGTNPYSAEFYDMITEAKFLMPEAVPYMDTVRGKIGELHAARAYLKAPNAASNPDFSKLIETETQVTVWLTDQHSAAYAVFERYLSFPEKKILGLF